MSGEIWQFLVVGIVGLVIAVLWLFIIYLPRRTAEGEGDNAAHSVETIKPTEPPEEPD